MPFEQILEKVITNKDRIFREILEIFSIFIKFVNNQFGENGYINYFHRDFKPLNLVLKNNKIFYIDSDDGKVSLENSFQTIL